MCLCLYIFIPYFNEIQYRSRVSLINPRVNRGWPATRSNLPAECQSAPAHHQRVPARAVTHEPACPVCTARGPAHASLRKLLISGYSRIPVLKFRHVYATAALSCYFHERFWERCAATTVGRRWLWGKPSWHLEKVTFIQEHTTAYVYTVALYSLFTSELPTHVFVRFHEDECTSVVPVKRLVNPPTEQ